MKKLSSMLHPAEGPAAGLARPAGLRSWLLLLCNHQHAEVPTSVAIAVAVKMLYTVKEELCSLCTIGIDYHASSIRVRTVRKSLRLLDSQ